MLDACFKAIPSLKEVIVKIYVYDNKGPNENLKKKMRDCRWTSKISKVEEPEYGLWIEHAY